MLAVSNLWLMTVYTVLFIDYNNVIILPDVRFEDLLLYCQHYRLSYSKIRLLRSTLENVFQSIDVIYMNLTKTPIVGCPVCFSFFLDSQIKSFACLFFLKGSGVISHAKVVNS